MIFEVVVAFVRGAPQKIKEKGMVTDILEPLYSGRITGVSGASIKAPLG